MAKKWQRDQLTGEKTWGGVGRGKAKLVMRGQDGRAWGLTLSEGGSLWRGLSRRGESCDLCFK